MSHRHRLPFDECYDGGGSKEGVYCAVGLTFPMYTASPLALRRPPYRSSPFIGGVRVVFLCSSFHFVVKLLDKCLPLLLPSWQLDT
jgi:hypothetical protein